MSLDWPGLHWASAARSPVVGNAAVGKLGVELSRRLLATSVVVLAPVGEFHTLLLNSIVMRGVRLTSVDESRHSWFLEASSGPRSLA